MLGACCLAHSWADESLTQTGHLKEQQKKLKDLQIENNFMPNFLNGFGTSLPVEDAVALCQCDKHSLPSVQHSWQHVIPDKLPCGTCMHKHILYFLSTGPCIYYHIFCSYHHPCLVVLQRRQVAPIEASKVLHHKLPVHLHLVSIGCMFIKNWNMSGFAGVMNHSRWIALNTSFSKSCIFFQVAMSAEAGPAVGTFKITGSLAAYLKEPWIW